MKKKLTLEGGKEVSVSDVPFELIQDGAVRVRTEDGTVLRVRPVIVSVLLMDERASDGSAQYVVQNFVHVFPETPREEKQ